MKTSIVFEDKTILVCYKPAGLAVQSGRIGHMDMESEIKNYLCSRKNAVPYLGVIHRLDQPVEGLLVFALDTQGAAELNRQLVQGNLEKKYFAVVCGKLPEGRQELVDYLIKDSKSSTAKVVKSTNENGKKAILSFECLSYDALKDISLAEIEIKTGRYHQIRVQMAHAGYPLLGDKKYGTDQSIKRSEEEGIKTVALCASFLNFIHPESKKKMQFFRKPENPIFSNFKQILEKENQYIS